MKKMIWASEDVAAVVKADSHETPPAPAVHVETVDNRIYFYAAVTEQSAFMLIKAIRDLDKRLRIERLQMDLEKSRPIKLHIHSGGGDLLAAFAVADVITTIETSVESYIDGYAASAATIISVAADERSINRNGFILIHQLSNFMWGNYEQLKDHMKLNDMAMEKVISHYAAHTELPEDEIKVILQRETWMNADMAFEKGFADDIWSQ